MYESLTAEDALQIFTKSEAAFIAAIRTIDCAIREAAQGGQRKIYFPSCYAQELAKKLVEHYTLNGFRIASFSSDTWDTAIHW